MIKGLGLAVVISTVAMGCGGGGGGSGGSGFNPSVPASKPLNQLSAADATKLCMDTDAYLNTQLTAELSSQDFACRALGLESAALSVDASSTDATVRKACQDAYTLCLNIPADAGANDVDAGTSSSDCTNAQQQLSTCSATVGQLSACVSEETSSIQSAFPPCNQLTVAKLTAVTGDGGADSTTSGPACTTLDTACPGLMGDTSMMSSMLSAAKSTTKRTTKRGLRAR
jgi:hypothetical protein